MLRCSFSKSPRAARLHRLPEVHEEHPQGVLEEVRLSVPCPGKHGCEMIRDMKLSTTFCNHSFWAAYLQRGSNM